MTCALHVVWDERLTDYHFGPGHPLAPVRIELTMQLMALRLAYPEVPVPAAVLAVGWPGRWTGHGVPWYRAAYIMISAVATIWIPPSTMNTPAPMAIARAMIRTDASSHTSNASPLMPAEQRALIRWEICGT